MKYNNKLKELRSDLELTQAEVAKEAGVSLRVYQEYEYGNSIPSVILAIKIANTLNTNVVDIWYDNIDLEIEEDEYRKRMSYKQELIAQGQTNIDESDLDLWVEFRESEEGSRLTKQEAREKERFFLFTGDTPLEYVKNSYGISDPEEIKEEIEKLKYNEDVYILKNGIIMEMY